MQKNEVLKNAALLFVGCLIAFFILEIFLRVWHPFEFRVRGNRIVLPANKEYRFTNDRIPALDRIIVHRKNVLGFRGAEKPREFDRYLTLITVGGSTTECFYLSDGRTWTDRLGGRINGDFKNAWINNAGLDGQSTYGHRLLMEDYIIKLKPKVVLFLIGANDAATTGSLSRYDRVMVKRSLFSRGIKEIPAVLADHSEVFSTALNIARYLRARKSGMGHEAIDFAACGTLEVPPREEEKALERHRQRLNDYGLRLEDLIRLSKENGIEPVFITQAAIFGGDADNVTGIDLGKIKIDGMTNGKLAWKILELYNDVTKSVAAQNGALCIDLAREMPKSSRYYYDFYHFNNEGADKAAQIIYDHLYPFLAKRYPSYLKRP